MRLEEWNFASLRERGYKDGHIVRCSMQNFLTYSRAEAFPGPNLNVVLGPNGTGKSALTHAICLACGIIPVFFDVSNLTVDVSFI